MSKTKNIILWKGFNMATYECKTWGMSVNATCAKCDEPLQNDLLVKDDGSEVQI